MKKEIEFNPDELIASVESFRDHVLGKQKLTLRTTKLVLPEPVKPIKPKEIRALRQRLHLSQAIFAKLLNVPTNTEISWEKGRRKPTGAALRLLDICRRKPTEFYELLAA
jgi:putative transcriptional regulator